MTIHTVNTLPVDPGPDCLMCAVRELTEGTPPIWNNPSALVPGLTIRGIVLHADLRHVGAFGPAPYVDLWTGGWGRMRVIGYSGSLANAIRTAEPKVGDRFEATYVGEAVLIKGPYAGRTVKTFTAECRRGHH